MLFMILERFSPATRDAVSERFRRRGRMLPAGVVYVASWMSTDGACCWQLMEAGDRAALDPWLASWSDLVEFEVTSVLPSAEYWASHAATLTDSER